MLGKYEQQVELVAQVLSKLQENGLKDPRVASGYVRGLITNAEPSDIDIQYCGGVEQTKAQEILKQVVEQLEAQDLDWDYLGIWDVSQYPNIHKTSDYHRAFFINSIDSVSLTASGELDDITGKGIEDGKNGVLRMNDFTKIDYPYKNVDIVYLCVRGCERVAKHGWNPTPESIELIKAHAYYWEKLTLKEKEYIVREYVTPKHSQQIWQHSTEVFDGFNWRQVFDFAENKKGTY